MKRTGKEKVMKRIRKEIGGIGGIVMLLMGGVGGGVASCEREVFNGTGGAIEVHFTLSKMVYGDSEEGGAAGALRAGGGYLPLFE
jgi:hypothetical protein